MKTEETNKPNSALKDTFKLILKDRLVLVCMIVVFLAGFSFFLAMLPKIEIFDHLIYTRYTIYGAEHYYRDRWFYRITVAFFGLLIAIGHNFLIFKLYKTSNRASIFVLTFFSIVVTILGFLVMNTVLGEIPN